MNKSPHSIWTESLGTYVAAAETDIATGKKITSARKALRAPQRAHAGQLALEQRIVFDAALAATFLEVPSDRSADPDPVLAQLEQLEAASLEESDATGVSDVEAGEPAVDTAILAREIDATDPESSAENVLSDEATADADHAQSDETDEVEGVEGVEGVEIIFVDQSAEGVVEYMDLHPGEVHFLDAERDGVEQMAAVLQGRTGINAIHVLSHGGDGLLELGTGRLNLSTLYDEYADELAMIKAALSSDADILIYGCDVASTEVGRAFVAALAELTGADIAASTDDTGAAELGGDWQLELQSGPIEAEAITAERWDGLLEIPVLDLDADDSSGALGGGIALGPNLVVNGDFAAGNSGFTTTYFPAGSSSSLSFERRYFIGDASVDWIPDATTDWVTADPFGSTTGQIMYINGSPTAGDVYWSQTLAVDPATDYQFAVWATNVNSWEGPSGNGSADPQFELRANGTLIASGQLSHLTAGVWQQFSGTYSPNGATSVTLSMSTGSGALAGNDLAVTGFSLNEVEVIPNPNYVTTFTENGPSVALADLDSSITDVDHNHLVSATVVLTNAQTGDVLSLGGSLPASVSASFDSSVSGRITVTLTGLATLEEYESALEALRFENTSDSPDTTDRIIEVIVNDGISESNTATTTIHVVPVNDPPDAVNDIQAANPGVASVVDLLGNDTDPDNDPLTVTVASLADPSQGTLVLVGTDWVFTSAPGVSGEVLINYTVRDPDGLTDSATHTIYVANQPPVPPTPTPAPQPPLMTSPTPEAQTEDTYPHQSGPHIPHDQPHATTVIPTPPHLHVLVAVSEASTESGLSATPLGNLMLNSPLFGEALAQVSDGLMFANNTHGEALGLIRERRFGEMESFIPSLYVQLAVRHQPITTDPSLWVQHAVRASQLESQIRSAMIDANQSATPGYSTLIDPFALGAPKPEGSAALVAETDQQQTHLQQIRNVSDSEAEPKSEVAVKQVPVQKTAEVPHAAPGFRAQLDGLAKDRLQGSRPITRSTTVKS